MRQVGRLVKWDDSRGFGFIQPAGGGPQVFVHISKIAGRVRPVAGAELTFEVARDLQNRLSAAHVRFGATIATSRQAPRDIRSTGKPWAAGLVAALALLAVGLAAWRGRIPILVPVLFVVASLVVFLAYAFDKAAAMNRRQRTPENLPHFMNLLGGWPGGLVASQLFRHKSKKLSFKATFYLASPSTAPASLGGSTPTLTSATRRTRPAPTASGWCARSPGRLPRSQLV